MRANCPECGEALHDRDCPHYLPGPPAPLHEHAYDKEAYATLESNHVVANIDGHPVEAYATLEQAPNTLTYRKRRHRWIKAKGLRAFWSTLRGIKSFTCACGANLHEHREGRLYSNFTGGDYRQSILLTRKTPIPGCTRGGVR